MDAVEMNGSRVPGRIIALVLAGNAFSCAAPASTTCDESASYIATEADFQGFRTWMRTSLGDDALAGHPPGPRYGYVRARSTVLCEGTMRYATGTVIVKTVENGVRPQFWDVFAMVRRGGRYNAGGDTGWEFFRLAIDGRDRVSITARGTDASLRTDTYPGGSLADGCNACHGTASARESDGVLAGVLAP